MMLTQGEVFFLNATWVTSSRRESVDIGGMVLFWEGGRWYMGAVWLSLTDKGKRTYSPKENAKRLISMADVVFKSIPSDIVMNPIGSVLPDLSPVRYKDTEFWSVLYEPDAEKPGPA